MLSAFLTFLGGTAFRMLWGEITSWLNKKQDHEHEVTLLRLQSDLDDKAHVRNIEAQKLQASLGITEIRVRSEADIEMKDAEAFIEGVKASGKPSGIAWVDAWNASIRPQYAEVALVVWIVKLVAQGFIMDEFDTGLLAVIAGYFFADRSLRRNGK